MVTFQVTVFMMLPVVLASISKSIMPNGAAFSVFFVEMLY